MLSKKVLLTTCLAFVTLMFTIHNLVSNLNDHKRYVFIDLGTNNGDSIKYFFDINPNYNESVEFLKGYGGKSNLKWEIYAVEANPFFNVTLKEKEAYYKSLGHRFYLYSQSAAWIRNEKLKFFLDTVNPGYNYWGSSLLENHPDVIRSNKTEVIVNGIDVADLLRRYNKKDEIILKVDIEGTEYQLLVHLIEQNVLKLVDVIAVEFHNNLVNEQNLLINRFNNFFKENNVKFVSWF